MAKNSGGLGRGLGAILEEVEEAYIQNAGGSDFVKELPLSDISVNPFQPRKQFDPESIAELGESIKRHGLLQPVVVIKQGDGYMLIAGERRLRASKLVGFEKIKAIVADIETGRIRELALIENIQRENLNPIELAGSLQELIAEHNLTHEELSDIVKKSRSFITNTLRLLSLDDYVKNKIASGKISYGHAKVMVGLESSEQIKITDSIIGQKLTVRDAEDLVSKIKRETPEKKFTQTKTTELDVNTLMDMLYKTYEIQSKKTGSALTLKFENQGQVEALINKLKNS